MTQTQWAPALVAALRAELAGNTRPDLITWANRVLRNPQSRAELDKARLVLTLAGEGVGFA